MPTTETATLGGGCFWCLEAVYDEMEGVVDVVSGYTGGATRQPTYEQVCSGKSGHVEVVQVKFDPAITSFRDILDVFFAIHDPTTLNRQGNDVGTQYRSVIFTHNEAQAEEARRAIQELAAEGTYSNPIVTAVEPISEFYAAEEYHQNYFVNHPEQGYCAYVVSPKVSKFRKKFAAKIRRT